MDSIDHALTRDERRRFDDALLRARGAGGAPPGSGPVPGLGPVTLYEEHVWLAQQQDPGAVLKHAVACRLTGTVDLARLCGALAAAVRAHPDLDARYRFGGDAELRKHRGGGWAPRLIRAEAREEAVGLILDRQGAGWDGERDPPFEALVIAGPGETVLALILHRVLDGAYPVARLLRLISDAYAGETPPATPSGDADAPGGRLLGPEEAGARLPAWMYRGAAARDHAVTVYGRTFDRGYDVSREQSAPALTGRCGASIGPGAGLARDASDAQALAWTAAQLARYLAALTGAREVDLLLGRVDDGWIGDPPPAVGGALHALTVDGREPLETVARAVREILDRPPRDRVGSRADWDDAPGTRGRPALAVGWTGRASEALRLDAVSVERLPLPTPEARADLAFTVGRDDRGGLAVDLVAGQALSPHIGPVLLERFLVWLDAGEAALPGRPAAAAPTDCSRPEDGDPGADAVVTLILAEFRDALDAPLMGPEDDFFDNGGHSLIATRIIGRLISRHGIELRFDELFGHPSAAALAARARRIGAPGAVETGASEDPEGAGAPLALAQASLWKIYAAFGFGEIFNLPFALDFLDPVDERLFERAFADVVERHAGLRSLFRQEGGQEGEQSSGAVRQEVVPAEGLHRYKWFWTSDEGAGIDRRDEAGHRFDLARELPLRIRFLTDPATGRQVLSFLFHHIALDEWSVNLMMDELVTAYRARAAGTVPLWVETPAPFHAFARAQHAAGVDPAHLAYWVDRLRDAPRPRPILERAVGQAEPARDSAAGGWVETKLDRLTTDGLYALAKGAGASLFNVVYASIAAALHRLGALPELVIGTSASGRGDPAYFDTVGYFTTVVVHRIRFEPDMRVGTFVARVRDTINESMPYTGIPIDVVEEALGMAPGRDHLFEVFIQIHAKNKLNGALELPDGRAIAFRQVDPERHESVLGLQFEVMEEMVAGERAIRVLMNYRSAHYGPAEVERITAMTASVLRAVARPGGSDLRLDALGAGEPSA